MTATQTETMKIAMNSGDPAKIASVLQRTKFGDMLEQVDETITLATVAASISLLTDSALKRAALSVLSVRVTDVTGGTADVGPRVVTDAGGTPAAKGANPVGICTLSADGATITFEGTVKAARIVWVPRPYVDADSAYAQT